MDILLAPEMRPFAVAAIMLLALVGIETVSLLLGFSLSTLLDKTIDVDGDGILTLNWLNVGGVPLLILIMLALAAFAMAGFLIQETSALIAASLPKLVASVAAIGIAIPIVRASSRAVARIVPRDETYVIELADLVGLTGEVSVGPLDQGLPGSVRVKDAHGNWHTLRARAAKEAPAMPVGSRILLVDQTAGIFAAIPAPSDLG